MWEYQFVRTLRTTVFATNHSQNMSRYQASISTQTAVIALLRHLLETKQIHSSYVMVEFPHW